MSAVGFTVYGTPAPAGSKKGFVNRKTGRVIITDDAKNSRPWKAQISDKAAEAMAGAPLLDGPVVLHLLFVVTRPKGHTGKRGLLPSAPAHPTTRPDVLKLARAVEDALSGIVYRDDAQIVAELLVKEYGEPARVEINAATVGSVQALAWHPAAAQAALQEGTG